MEPTHIICDKKDVAKIVFLPGDPLRAKWMAKTFFNKGRKVTNIRNMAGYTGKYKGVKVTAMGAGIGMDSMAIYAEELIRFYGAKIIIRVGSCGSMKKKIKLRDIIIPIAASTDSNKVAIRFNPLVHYGPFPDPGLYDKACKIAAENKIKFYSGGVYSTMAFYQDRYHGKKNGIWKRFAEYGNLVVDMESAELFTLGQEHGVKVLTLLTVSDHLITFKKLDSKDRERGFKKMMKLALKLI